MDHKEGQRNDAFKVWCWRRLLRVFCMARRSNLSILKEINPKYSWEGHMLKLKLQYFGHLIAKNRLTGKDPDPGKYWGQEEKGTTEDETVGWHHQLDGHEFEQTLGDSEGQGSLVCYSPWGRKESDTTEWLNNNSKVNIKLTTSSVTAQFIQAAVQHHLCGVSEHVHHPQKETRIHPPYSLPSPRQPLSHFLSVWICWFWIYPMNGIL